MAVAQPLAADALKVVNATKAYGATVALAGMSFTVARGEVHALLGENGAGKSTTVKMLSGFIQPDAGSLELFGEPVRLARPQDAQRLGVQTAYQEMTLVRDLTVTDNMLLPRAPTGMLGQLRRREGERQVAAHLASLGLADVDPRAEIRELELPVRQKIEIARAVFRKPRILLLDEPTSSLTGRDIDWLGELIRTVTRDGVTVVFISHRMPEVRMFCDRLTVLRNGKEVGTAPVDQVSDDEVVRMIIGRSLAATFPPRPKPRAKPATPPVLEARRVATAGRLEDGNFSLWPGEILGIAALQGMGQQQLFLSCFGMAPLTSGQILVDGREVTLASPKDAIAANIGISLVPEDRKTEGLFLKLDGRRNVSLPVIDRFTRHGLIDEAAETEAVERVFRQVEVAPRALYTPAGAFSGGNQQKIAIGKWLLAGSRTLLMFDPTRGVDVGTKHQLYLMMRAFADAGGAVLFHSTELAELVNLCDRVQVMYGGRTVAELAGDEIEEEAIMRFALGEQRPAGMAA
ncbi:MAG TPA: sugar ABC transporter ATP-binding protein [Geminicoccus sp.]|uniref:sugar ABC transporter ATP-binding protein n=1 Tax=Geminicoccus sp. TaxID=2024832 RepID=UPI002C0AFC3A|nr:sugar ABC transporter ATP-binding protein [Geminicoccus sp.]HWL67373.1 sugar ABC transporter ATP-binding protein [Geminicoccus sp.]